MNLPEDLGILPGRRLAIEANGEHFIDGIEIPPELTTAIRGVDMSGEDKTGETEEPEVVSFASVDEKPFSPLDEGQLLLLLKELVNGAGNELL